MIWLIAIEYLWLPFSRFHTMNSCSVNKYTHQLLAVLRSMAVTVHVQHFHGSLNLRGGENM
jgi:exosortase/archaeosortase